MPLSWIITCSQWVRIPVTPAEFGAPWCTVTRALATECTRRRSAPSSRFRAQSMYPCSMASTASFMVINPFMSSGPNNSTDAIATSLIWIRSPARFN